MDIQRSHYFVFKTCHFDIILDLNTTWISDNIEPHTVPPVPIMIMKYDFFTHPPTSGKMATISHFQMHFHEWNVLYLYPRPTKLEGRGVYWIHLVCPSVRLSVDDMVSGA